MFVAKVNDALQNVGRVFSSQRIVAAKAALQNAKKVNIKAKVLVYNRLIGGAGGGVMQSEIKVEKSSNQPINLKTQ